MAAFVAQGCAMARIEPEPPQPGPGAFTAWKGRPGLVIGAPHGTSDRETDRIGLDLARRTGFGVVVATGHVQVRPGGRRLNVNRPTEGVVGAPASEEVETPRAREAYEAYARRVREVAQGPLALYVEIHGNGRQGSNGRIEIATVGVSLEEAWRLRTLLELIRDARLPAEGEPPRLEVLVEPLDRISLTASGAKQAGVLRLPRRAMHIELPRSARVDHREAWTDVLAEFLVEAARLLVGSEP
jgi:hypothetical protein